MDCHHSRVDVVTPDTLNATLVRTSICGLGQVALGPVLSILDRFPEVARATDGD